MATVRSVTKTHLMVLTKEAFDTVIAKIEKRILNEKLNFLSEIPVFSFLTKNSLARITYSMSKIQISKNMHLFREGEPAQSVFIVISGELEVTKTSIFRQAVE